MRDERNDDDGSNDGIRQRLEETVGVLPCHEWLDACRDFLLSQSKPMTSDEVLYHVLNTDLRSVVRGQDDSNNNTNTTNAAARQLQLAIQASQFQDTRKQVLPNTFKLLFQIEELLDVSRNAESRYTVGPASATNPQPTGNQNLRCLKLCLAHGHNSNNNNNRSNLPIIIAMEESVIHNISANTLAGAKMIVHGNVTIRFGVMMLHEGNTTVLGGSVQELVEIQKRALEQAKQQAGVGVDPTIRALIGTNTAVLDEADPEDEAHEESRDVPEQQQQQMNTTTTIGRAPAAAIGDVMDVDVEPPLYQQQQQQQQPRNNNPTMPAPPTRTVQTRPRVSNGSTSTARLSSDSTSSFVTAASVLYDSSPTNARNNSNHNNSLNPYASNRTTTTTTTSSTTPNNRNPYASSATRNSASSQTSTNASHNPYAPSSDRDRPTQSSSSNNPYATNSNNAQRTTSVASTNSNSTRPTATNNGASRSVNPYASSGTTSNTNPYQSSTTSRSTSTTPASQRNAPGVPARNTTTPRNNTYGSDNASYASTPHSASSSNTTNPYSTTTIRSQQRQHAQQNQNQHRVQDDDDVVMVDSSNSVTTALKPQTTTPSSSQSPLPLQIMTFPSLLSLLEQLLQNRQMYESYHKTLSVKVKLQRLGGQMHFCIDKTKNYKKLKRPKYHIVINATFGMKSSITSTQSSTSSSDGVVLACKLDPVLVEPYFGKAATDLRALNKTDKVACQQLVEAGGSRVNQELFTERYWKATLHPTPEEVFDGGKKYGLGNVLEPILYLEKVD